jgi:putative hydrolase of the HAD superfamily
MNAIFFDMDDTILADSEATDECWAIVCRRHGVEHLYEPLLRRRDWFWSDAGRHRAGRIDMRAARREIVARTFADEGLRQSDLAERIADDYTDERHRRVYPFPGALEKLAALHRRGIPLALITNGDHRFQRDKIERFGLTKFFRCIVVEGEFGTGKPDHAVFLHTLKTLQVQPQGVCMVGDNLAFDIAPAQHLGMHGVWVDHRRAGLPGTAPCIPHLQVHAIAEIPEPGTVSDRT